MSRLGAILIGLYSVNRMNKRLLTGHSITTNITMRGVLWRSESTRIVGGQGSAPDPPTGAYHAPPLPSRLGRGNPLPISLPLNAFGVSVCQCLEAAQFWLAYTAFGVSVSARSSTLRRSGLAPPLNCKSWRRHWRYRSHRRVSDVYTDGNTRRAV